MSMYLPNRRKWTWWTKGKKVTKEYSWKSDLENENEETGFKYNWKMDTAAQDGEDGEEWSMDYYHYCLSRS